MSRAQTQPSQSWVQRMWQ